MTSRIASLNVLLLALVCAPPMLGQPPNLISNPGFDGGPDSWRMRSEPGRYEARWDHLDRSGSAGSGSAYTLNQNVGLHGAIVQTVPVIAGETYLVAASVFAPAAQASVGEARVAVTWQTDQRFLSGAASLKTAAEGGWVDLSHEIVAPAGATAANVNLGVFLPNPGAREAYFDDLFFGLANPGSAMCTPTSERACLGDRFEVRVEFSTARNGGVSGDGIAVSLNGLGITSGVLFYFFSADNPEMLIKVLDGCAINDHFWVFYSAGTDVFFRVRVTDLQSGRRFLAINPDGTAAPPLQEVEAFPCV